MKWTHQSKQQTFATKQCLFFNVEYPVQAYDPWLFIQRGLYSMELSYDNIVPRVARIAK